MHAGQSMKRVLAFGAIICILTGCGTVQNFERGGAMSNATPYGGVEIAAERMKAGPHEGDFMRLDDQPPWLTTADVVGSAIGDTLTLPVTIALQVAHDINEYYFTPEKPPATGREQRNPPIPPSAPIPPRQPNP